MASLLEIRKKIHATKNTRKITKAMQLVAASKMKRFQKKAVSARLYSWDLLKVLKATAMAGQAGFDEQSDLELCEKRESGKTLFVLYTSDKGLCGALNSRLIKALFQGELWNATPVEERLLITIGKKSMDFARYSGIEVAKSFHGVDEKLNTLDVLGIIDEILKYWHEHKVKRVVMAAPHYKNSLVYYPVVKSYLPFSPEMVDEHLNVEKMAEGDLSEDEDGIDAAGSDSFMIYEPSEERFQEQLVSLMVYGLFVQSFLELKAAEYSSRMIAMQSATDAAGDIIERLTLKFNKARQAAITQQIAELVSGSMV